MREDMARVIVERPRIGSRLRSRKKGYRKHVQRTALEDSPRREPMLGRWHGRQKSLNEHLGPMRRFLRSQVGRPWNKVHQDLCEHISFDNAVQKHVLAHVFDFVHRLVEMRDGVVYDCDGWGWRRGRALNAGEMYVCPHSGLLKVVRPKRQTHLPQRIEFAPLTQFHWRDNGWWEVRLRKPPSDPDELWDVWLERLVSKLKDADRMAAYGGQLFAVSKRVLAREEVRSLKRLIRSRRTRR